MKTFVTAACLTVLALSSLSANDQRARVLMQAAEAKAKIEGDLSGAIKLYKDAEKEAGSNRALVAQSLVKMAEAYQKLGDVEAQKIYQRLVRDFSDQKELVAVARARLQPANTAGGGATLKDVANLNASGNVSADGRYASFVNWETGNIAVRDLRTGSSREITKRQDYDIYNPLISRDGALVAYQSFNGCVERNPFAPGPGVLCVLATEGEPAAVARTVLENDDIRNITPLDWSPDGGSLAVSIQRNDRSAQIAVVRLADAALTAIATVDWRGPTRIYYSPDGRYLAFDLPADDASHQRDIRVIGVDGTQGSIVVEDPAQDVVMGWTPDGSRLLFASDRSGAVGLWAQRVARGRREGPPQLVHAGLGGLLSLGLTKAGSLYFGVQTGGRDIEIVTVDLQSGKQLGTSVRPVSRLVGTNLMPAWSPDGKFLAYVSQRGISGNTGRIIGIREMATGAVRELPPTLDYMGPLSWAPDGTRLVTNGRDLKGRNGIYEIDVVTGNTTWMGEGGQAKHSPDGRHLFQMRPMKEPWTRALVERDRSTGIERVLFTGEFATFSISADGKWIALASGGVGDASAHAIQLIRVETGEVRELLRAQPGERLPPYVPMPWTPDGQALLVRKPGPRPELWLIPTTGAAPRKIAADIESWAFGTFGVISLHPDGRQLAGTRLSETGAEVRVLDDFLQALR
jgi:Tol biopolymer transport system component